jgi:hypothetical protein
VDLIKIGFLRRSEPVFRPEGLDGQTDFECRQAVNGSWTKYWKVNLNKTNTPYAS